MIHWGTEIPSNVRIELPAEDELCPAIDDSAADDNKIKPAIRHIFFAEHPRQANSLTHLNVDGGGDSDDSSSKGGSTSNLIGSVWLNRFDRIHHPMNKESFRRKSEATFQRALKGERKGSTSCDDFSSVVERRRTSASDMVIDIDTPASISKSQDLAVYMSISNRSETRTNMVAVLRIDAGRRKLRTMKKALSVNGFGTEELSILYPGEDLWQIANCNELKHFTVIATIHVQETGEVLSKIEHIKVHPQHKVSLANTINHCIGSHHGHAYLSSSSSYGRSY